MREYSWDGWDPIRNIVFTKTNHAPCKTIALLRGCNEEDSRLLRMLIFCQWHMGGCLSDNSLELIFFFLKKKRKEVLGQLEEKIEIPVFQD